MNTGAWMGWAASGGGGYGSNGAAEKFFGSVLLGLPLFLLSGRELSAGW